MGGFHLADHGTKVRTELVAGATTFLTMAYIIFVNPDILSVTGMDKQALIAVTCLVSAVACIVTGLLANAPIAMAPGMGLNAFFAYTLVGGEAGVTWQIGLGVVFISGVFFLLLTLVGLRRRLVEAIPGSLTAAISVGIGLFITFIGLQNMGLIVDSPATLVTAGDVTTELSIQIGLAGLLVMVLLEVWRVPGALLIGIAFATGLGGALRSAGRCATGVRIVEPAGGAGGAADGCDRSSEMEPLSRHLHADIH